MLGSAIQDWLTSVLGPEGFRQAFYLVQIGMAAFFVFALWWMRPVAPQSGFAVREADLRAARKKAAHGASRAAATRDPLAEARMERKQVLSLPGIRIEGPPHEVLGVRPGASAQEIHQAYRERMKQYHPDRVGRPGSREWQDAQRIAEAINHARTELLKRAGARG
jgi:hypothetical protein